MEQINLIVSNPDAFDGTVHGENGLPDYGDLTVITKDGGMESGRACAVLTFSVAVAGEKKRAQTVVPVRLLLGMLRTLSSYYSDDGRPYQTMGGEPKTQGQKFTRSGGLD